MFAINGHSTCPFSSDSSQACSQTTAPQSHDGQLMAKKKPSTRYDDADNAGEQCTLLGDASPIGSEDNDDDGRTLVGAGSPGEHDEVDWQADTDGGNNADLRPAIKGHRVSKANIVHAPSTHAGRTLDVGVPRSHVLFTRATFDMNSDTLNAGGTSSLAGVATTPLMIPMDISGVRNTASSLPVTTGAAAAPVANPAGDAATSPAPETSSKPSSAMALASPKLLVGAAVVLATIFAL
ncbi:hypothetical protein C8R46DRAFT_1325832 [Mycena filopes]|nr:hypothetical protein C8R46DRAFT_1325832 [Mycena filopes]